MGGTGGQGVFENVAPAVLALWMDGTLPYGEAVSLLALLVNSLRQETDWDTVDDIHPDLKEHPLIHSALLVSGWYEGSDNE